MTESAPAESAHRYPPRSKMLDTYLSDVGASSPPSRWLQCEGARRSICRTSRWPWSDANLSELVRRLSRMVRALGHIVRAKRASTTPGAPRRAHGVGFRSGVPFKADPGAPAASRCARGDLAPVPLLSQQISPEELPRPKSATRYCMPRARGMRRRVATTPSQQNLARLGVLR